MIRAWTLLAWLLVGFPLFLGGIWIRTPALKLELVQLAVPVAIIALLALALRMFKNEDLSRSSFTRVFIRGWGLWRTKLAENPKYALATGVFLVGSVWALAALRRHWAFGSGAADLGIFTNAISNLTSGRGYISSVKDGINLFADHQSPILWCLAPFFALVPRAETLLVLQSFALAAGAIPLYFIGKQHLQNKGGSDRSEWIPAALALLYWAYTPTRNANLFDFHPEVLMLPCFLGAIAGIQSQRWKTRLWGVFFMVLSLMGKESAGVVAVGLGLAWILGAGPLQSRAFCRKAGVLTALLGFAVFLFNLKVVPGLFDAKYVYNDQYARFGGGLVSILLAPFTQPGLFFSTVFGKTRIEFLIGTLAPLAFAPLLNPRALIAAAPGYLILFLTEGDHRVNLQYHYAIEPSVGVFFALPTGLMALARFWNSRPKLSQTVPMGALLLFFALVSFGRSEVYRIRFHSPTPHQSWLRSELIPCVSASSVAVSGAMTPHLATLPWAHHLPRWTRPNGELVECVVVDPSVNNWPLSTPEFEAMPEELKKLGYSKIYSCQSLEVFQSPAKQGSCLSCQPRCPTR